MAIMDRKQSISFCLLCTSMFMLTCHLSSLVYMQTRHLWQLRISVCLVSKNTWSRSWPGIYESRYRCQLSLYVNLVFRFLWPKPVSHVCCRGCRFEMSKWKLARHQLPEAKAEAEDISLARVFGALGEHLWGHPA